MRSTQRTAAQKGAAAGQGRSTTCLKRWSKPLSIQPTIIYDYPTAVSPLSKQKPDDPDHVERFEFFAGGFELGNAFSELNDPVEQKKRFEDQLAERAAATTKRTRWTRTTCGRWLTDCRRRAAKASASTG